MAFRSLSCAVCSLIAIGVGAAVGFGCDTLGSVVVEAGDFAGAKADAYCDRRYVTDGGQPAAFCQEVVATVAAAEFADDCRSKHQATAGSGLCPRPRIIAGCKLLEKHDDDSQAWDWYYDVEGTKSPKPFDSQTHSVAEVRAYCGDVTRYDKGAELATP